MHFHWLLTPPGRRFSTRAKGFSFEQPGQIQTYTDTKYVSVLQCLGKTSFLRHFQLSSQPFWHVSGAQYLFVNLCQSISRHLDLSIALLQLRAFALCRLPGPCNAPHAQSQGNHRQGDPDSAARGMLFAEQLRTASERVFHSSRICALFPPWLPLYCVLWCVYVWTISKVVDKSLSFRTWSAGGGRLGRLTAAETYLQKETVDILFLTASCKLLIGDVHANQPYQAVLINSRMGIGFTVWLAWHEYVHLPTILDLVVKQWLNYNSFSPWSCWLFCFVHGAGAFLEVSCLQSAPVRLQACSGAQKLGKSFVNAFFALKCLAPRATKHVCCYSQSFVWSMSEHIDGARFLGSLELLMLLFLLNDWGIQTGAETQSF